jgi:colanic acid/amylovoran biosynthesis glycosyltransferase
VLHVVSTFGQRSETFIADVVADLDALGWTASVASLWPPVNREEFPFPPPERFLSPRRPPLWRSAVGRITGRSARVRGAEWWRPIVEDVQPDLVHIHFGWAAAKFAFERLPQPTVLSFHGSDVRSWPHESPTNRRTYDELFQVLRYAVASSVSIADEVSALGFQGRIEVINPGVRLDRFPFQMPSTDGESNRLLYVGRQVTFKGLDILLTAMRHVVDQHPNTVLAVIGDGPEAGKNEELARSLGLADHIEFRGAQPHSEVAVQLRAAQALVVPSRTTPVGDAEGHPVAPKEAFAAGVPVIATNSGGLVEVIPPRQREGLVPEGDAPALAQAIVEFLERRDTWRERATVAREWAEEQLDSSKLAERLGRYYAEICESRGTHPR